MLHSHWRRRYIAHTVAEFSLVTAYAAPGQEHVGDDDDKEKVPVQPNAESIGRCTRDQLEGIARGWMRHIRKTLKAYEQKAGEP